ncbi:MAG: molybdopterin dinucleotide binding domain-containing protein, partial [Solirubrobacteraceae bacterium]
AAALGTAESVPFAVAREAIDIGAPAPANGALRLGTYRPLWAAPECEVSPALKYLIPSQQLELSPEDARRLGIADGASVTVAQNGTRLAATVVVRTGVQEGSAFLAEGLASQSANALTESLIEVSAR